MQVARVFLGVT